MTDLLTPRLRLRRHRPGDEDHIAALNAFPEVMRYISGGAGLPVGSPESRDAVDRFVERMRDDNPIGIWAVEWRENGTFLGLVFLIELPKSDKIEVGYRYRPDCWGRGVATEAAERMVRYGFEEVGLDEICGVTHPDNHASQRVLRKIGLSHHGKADYYDTVVEFFSVSRADFLGLS